MLTKIRAITGISAILLSVLAFFGCNGQSQAGPTPAPPEEGGKAMIKATFAGGCFWCMEPPYGKLKGVTGVVVGYTGGTEANPTYDDYAGKGHVEAVEVTYDPAVLRYEDLLQVFWRQIDPTDAGGQFADRGPHYRSAIFYHDEEQKRLAEKSKAELAASGRFQKPIATEILPATAFYAAEDYHQGYYKKNAPRYQSYRSGSGREPFLEKTWGKEREVKPAFDGASLFRKPPAKELKGKLTPLQYEVTQQCGTEPPFRNAYWNNHREGIYVDVVTGEPLFSSRDKFDSGTGWPSFVRPLKKGNIVEKEDNTLGMARTEVRSKHGDSHLGHLFPDGPKPTGQRYCINSASLRFIPKENLEKEGYGKYLKLFEK